MKKILSTILIAILSVFLICCSGGTDLIKYEILNNRIQDRPSETQIVLNVLIKPDPSLEKSQLETLLNYLYERTLNKGNYKSHKKPNTIGIYLYTSKEKAESGMGQWIARLAYSKSTDNIPKIYFQSVQLKSLSTKPIKKYGLSVKNRKEIWTTYINFQDKAQKTADKKIPTYGSEFKKGNIKKNMALVKRLNEKYKRKVAAKYHVKEAIVDSIMIEGLSEGWPFPKY